MVDDSQFQEIDSNELPPQTDGPPTLETIKHSHKYTIVRFSKSTGIKLYQIPHRIPKFPGKLVILYGMWEGVQDHIVKEFIHSFKITKPIKQNQFLQHKLGKEAIFYWEMHDSRVPFVRHSIKLLTKGGSLRPHRCRMGRNVWFLCWKLHDLGDQKWCVWRATNIVGYNCYLFCELHYFTKQLVDALFVIEALMILTKVLRLKSYDNPHMLVEKFIVHNVSVPWQWGALSEL